MSGRAGPPVIGAIACGYPGEVWWLPLAARLRGPHGFDQQAFVDCITAKIGTPFDLVQGAGVVLWEFLNRLGIDLPGPQEELGCFYCSELVAAAFERGGIVGRINASKVSPGDLCSWWLYEPQYVQFKGDASVKIRPYNSEDPSRWERLIAAIEALRRDKDSFVLESTRLRNLATQAISALRETGATNKADQFEAQL